MYRIYFVVIFAFHLTALPKEQQTSLQDLTLSDDRKAIFNLSKTCVDYTSVCAVRLNTRSLYLGLDCP